MILSKFFRSLFGKRRPARRGYAPRIESLEDRRLLSVGKQQFLGSNLRHHGVILDFPPPVVTTAPASVSGCVYVDLNNNGVMDPGEAPLAGVTINLFGSDDRGQAVGMFQMTAADGSFHFRNLRPGSYSLNEVQPTGYFDGKDSLGSAGGQKTNDEFTDIFLNAGVDAVNYKFGELPPASLKGCVFVDTNNNGQMEPG